MLILLSRAKNSAGLAALLYVAINYSTIISQFS